MRSTRRCPAQIQLGLYARCAGAGHRPDALVPASWRCQARRDRGRPSLITLQGVTALAAELDTILPEAAAQARTARIAVLTGRGRPRGARQPHRQPAGARPRRRISSISPSGPAAASARSRVFISAWIRYLACRSSEHAALSVPATDDYERLARDRAVETLIDAHAGLTQEIATASNGARCAGWLAAPARGGSRAHPQHRQRHHAIGPVASQADGRGRYAGRSAAPLNPSARASQQRQDIMDTETAHHPHRPEAAGNPGLPGDEDDAGI